MRIFYGSGNILVTSQMGGGASSQIIGFISALRKAGHCVDMDVSGNQNLYPRIRTRPWLAWVRKNIPFSWLGYETLQILNNRKIRRRLRQKDLSRYDLVWQRYELFTTAYAEAARGNGLPNIFFVDAPLIPERQQYAYLWLKGIAQRVMQYNVEAADLVVTVSSVIGEYIRQSVGNPRLDVYIMPNGFAEHLLDCSESAAQTIRQRYFGDFQGKIVGFVGAPMRWHRLDYLIQVAHQLRQTRNDFRVLMIGEGPDSPNQYRLVDDLNLQEIVKFTGIIPFADIAPYLHALDIGVMPDSNLYGSPMKIAEYMACGAVVVAPDLPPIREFCTHETDSLLFQKDDLNALRNNINRLLDSQMLTETLRENARKKALANYSWEARIKQLEPLLDTLQNKYLRTV